MKIAILGIRGIPGSYGGFETCADFTSRYWIQKGHKVIVYCRRHWYKETPSTLDGVKLYYTPSIKTKLLDTPSHTLFSIFHLLFFESKVTHVHLYNTSNGLFAVILRLFRIKVYISVDGIEWKRDKWGWLGKKIHKIGEYFAVKFATNLVVDNEEVFTYYQTKYRIKNTSLIKYGAKQIKSTLKLANPILNKYKLKSKEYFLFVGRIVPEKGVHNLIDTYSKIVTPFPLVIIGDDQNDTSYKRNVIQNKSDRIRFLGFIYEEEYEQLLVHALMYVSASHLEGTSPSLVAAMSAGTCAFVNGIPENIFTVGDNAFCFNANDFDDMARKWQELSDNIHLIQEMARKGTNFSWSTYSWDKISRQYLQLFDKNVNR